TNTFSIENVLWSWAFGLRTSWANPYKQTKGKRPGMKITSYSFTAALFVMMLACNHVPSGRGAGEVENSPQSNTNFRVEKVVEGLQVPWSIVWAPDGRMIFTERVGRVRVFE